MGEVFAVDPLPCCIVNADQDYGLDAKIEALKDAGCDPEYIHHEKVSSVASRPKLEEVLKHLRKGDILVVTKLDRLARSMRDPLRIVDMIQGKKEIKAKPSPLSS
jgi:DNA invertase Pin-like site-specific DNA recombinase